jgi:hypothetical protein
MLIPRQSEPLSRPHESRRSSRIPLFIRFQVSGTHPQSGAGFQAAGKTLVVHEHGALIATIPGLPSGTPICITIPATGKFAKARVVWDGAASEGRYGIELESSESLWGIFFPPPAVSAAGDALYAGLPAT